MDRESAYERLKEKTEKQAVDVQQTLSRGGRAAPKSQTSDLIMAVAKSASHAVGSQIGRQIIPGVLGSLFGGRG